MISPKTSRNLFHSCCFYVNSYKASRHIQTAVHAKYHGHCNQKLMLDSHRGVQSSQQIRSKNLSTTFSDADVSHLSLSKRLKRYGMSFILVDFCTWSCTVSTFFVLYSVGVEMGTIISFSQQLIDVLYWADTFGVPVKSLTGDTAALSLAFVSATITFPLRLFLDLLILVVLNRLGIIYGPRQSSLNAN